MDQEARQEQLVVFRNPAMYRLTLTMVAPILGLGIVAVSLFFMTLPRTKLIMILALVGGIFLILSAFWLFVYSLRMLSKKGPAIVATPSGLTLDLGSGPPECFEWPEILAVYLSASAQPHSLYMCFLLRDADEYAAGKNWLLRLFASLNEGLCGSPVAISPSVLNVSWEVMAGYFARYTMVSATVPAPEEVAAHQGGALTLPRK